MIVERRKKTSHPPAKQRSDFELYATTAAGLEETLSSELRNLNAKRVEPQIRGVRFEGDLSIIYRANMWTRTAHRILFKIAEFESSGREALYDGTRSVDWSEHMSKNGSLAIDAVTHKSELKHTRFISQVVKDAIVDQFREKTGSRPSVDRQDPDLRINAHLHQNKCLLSVDTSGERLHRRGYRPLFGLDAPLKETLAAGILLLSEYDGTRPLVDPMCGAGTLLIEGALIAQNKAPGLLGRSFGFMRHPTFDKTLWRETIASARAQIRLDCESIIIGSDIDENAVRAASAAAQGAGIDDIVRLKKASYQDLKPRSGGMVVTNPPYGERLGEIEELGELYRDLGNILKQRCRGQTAHIFTGSKFLAGRIGLHAKKRDILWNGGIECRLLHFDLY